MRPVSGRPPWSKDSRCESPPAASRRHCRTSRFGPSIWACLQAGAGIKGEFENRLKSVIKEVTASPRPVILFIDEAHTLIGAGGGSGQGDAANLLKPALARGELRTIAATTWAEYKKYFEKDAALARRFQVVKVDEPDEPRAIDMMRGLVETLEQHHKVRILNEAIVDAVRLSSRYISGRQLPDKALSLLDTTCARIGLSRTTTPPAIEDGRRQIEQIDLRAGILRRESELGADHGTQLDALAAEKARIAEDLAQKETRWARERELVDAIIEVRTRIAGGSGALTPDGNGSVLAELKGREDELRSVQGESPLVHADVNSQAVSETVGAWTGIPVGRMMADQVSTVLNLKSLMERQIVGQSHALDRIAQSIRTSRANLTDPRTPVGVFLLAGTSGVGKTETAIVLAELLYGGQQNMTVINMSEFKEEHKVSLLMGSPPGYVGYGEGGVLTEAVRRKPYSVVLLDEMEKCHAGVQDIFYQVFDKGTLKDGEGRDIDFKNTVILMTTNAGTDLIKKSVPGSGHRPRSRRVCHGGVSRAVEDLQAGVPGAGHDRALLSAVGRGDAENHRSQAWQGGASNRGTLQSHVLICARVGRHHCAAVHRSRHRGPQRRPHPDEDPPSGDVHRVSGTHS